MVGDPIGVSAIGDWAVGYSVSDAVSDVVGDTIGVPAVGDSAIGYSVGDPVGEVISDSGIRDSAISDSAIGDSAVSDSAVSDSVVDPVSDEVGDPVGDSAVSESGDDSVVGDSPGVSVTNTVRVNQVTNPTALPMDSLNHSHKSRDLRLTSQFFRRPWQKEMPALDIHAETDGCHWGL